MGSIADLFQPKSKAILFSKGNRGQLLSCCIQELFQLQARFILLNVSLFIETIPFPSLAPVSLKLGYDRNLYDKRFANAKFRESDFFLMHRALEIQPRLQVEVQLMFLKEERPTESSVHCSEHIILFPSFLKPYQIYCMSIYIYIYCFFFLVGCAFFKHYNSSLLNYQFVFTQPFVESVSMVRMCCLHILKKVSLG